MTGATRPDSRSGHTCSRRLEAISPFCATVRARNVEPAIVSRRCSSRARSICALAPPCVRDLHEPPFERQQLEVARDVVAADDVEHDVDAAPRGRLAQHRDEVGFVIVDGALGAERFARGALRRRSRGREHARAEHASELNGRRADAARSAVDEQRFARREPAALEDVVPDRKERFGERRGLRE